MTRPELTASPEAFELPAGGGIFAVYSADLTYPEAPALAVAGASANQNRGELVTHMAFLDHEDSMTVIGDRSLVGDAYERFLKYRHTGHAALVHLSHNAAKQPNGVTEPYFQPASDKSPEFSLSFDGAVRFGEDEPFTGSAQVLADRLARYMEVGATTEQAVVEMVGEMQGAYSLAVLDGGLTVARSANGTHPLNEGMLEDGFVTHVFSSEPLALETLNAAHIREVDPGTIVTVNPDGRHEIRFAEPDIKSCIYNAIHVARRGGEFAGRSVERFRQQIGKMLAEQDAGLEADLVLRVPEAASPIALGYAHAKGLPYSETAIQRSRYDYPFATAFDFPQMDALARARASFSIAKESVVGKKIVLVDDAVGTGATSLAVTELLLDAGASEVHGRSGLPPRQESCQMGGGNGKYEDLLAHGVSEAELKKTIAGRLKQKSYDFLSILGVAKAFESSEDEICSACIGGLPLVK